MRDGDFPGQMVPWFAAIRWSAGDSEELKEADYLYIVFNRSIVMRVALAAGRHAVTLGDGAPLPAGMYFVRLTQGRQNALSRVAVLR